MTTLQHAPATGAADAAPHATRETVHVLTWRLLDYDGGDLTFGGLQRWLLGLVAILRDGGHEVVIHQRAHARFERELRPGVLVRGHRAPMGSHGTPLFNLRVHRGIPAGAPVIYMAEDVGYPRLRRRSAVIQHGVWWDGELSRLKHRVTEHIVRSVIRRTAAAICVDTNFINWYRARWPGQDHDSKLHYVPNFVDPGVFGPQPEIPAAATAPGDRVTICFPRRSEPRRGILLAAAVAPTLMQEHDEVDFRFVVGSGYHTETLRQRLLASGVDQRRWSIEVLPFDRMQEAYRRSAIVMIPTICGEGTSLSAIEAMYFGCAVVSTWVGGLPNLIQHGHNGLLIPPRETELRSALARLIEDAGLRRRLGAQAMSGVLPQFGADRWRQSVSRLLGDHLGLHTGVPR